LAAGIGLPVLAGLALTWRRQTLLVLGVVLLAGLLGGWMLVIPRRLVPPMPSRLRDGLDDQRLIELEHAHVKLRNDLRTTALQAIAGLAVLAGAIVAFQQVSSDRQQAAEDRKLTRQGQASERFTRAIGQLGNDPRREVQIGAIYSLEQIAKQAPDNRLAVTEVLVAYLHRRAPRPTRPGPGPVDELRVRAPDIQAVLTVLGRREIVYTDLALDLRNLDLRSADLNHATLNPVNLTSTDLRGANLYGADLYGAKLSHADLRGAKLSYTDLRSADLRSADLRGSDFNGTHLSTADLRKADLRKADLGRMTPNPDEPAFSVKLGGADLRGADLSDIDPSAADFGGAVVDRETLWPPNFDWRRLASGVTVR
jgi:hypothetical protein